MYRGVPQIELTSYFLVLRSFANPKSAILISNFTFVRSTYSRNLLLAPTLMFVKSCSGKWSKILANFKSLCTTLLSCNAVIPSTNYTKIILAADSLILPLMSFSSSRSPPLQNSVKM